MPYTNDTRVLHLGDVANTGSNLVQAAMLEGKKWALRDLPAAPSLTDPSAWARRGLDLLKYATDGVKPELQHIHYGPNGYYGSVKKAPYVLHLHGTDLRQDLHRPLIGNVEQLAIKRAAKVLVATPDLLEAAQSLRPDAEYVPNPLPLQSYLHALESTESDPHEGEGSENPAHGQGHGHGHRHEQGHGHRQATHLTGSLATILAGGILQPPSPETPNVFFSARWDDSKGGLPVVEFARELVEEGVRVTGIDWGTHAGQARAAGVVLHPLLSPEGFEALLGEATVVVGQFNYGMLTISDLQALGSGRPLVSWTDNSLETDFPFEGTRLDQAKEQILNLLEEPSLADSTGGKGRDWVLAHRSPGRAVALLEDVYRGVLD